MSAAWTIQNAGLGAVERLAAFLALILRPGDVVGLAGELGAGKTTFARALIHAVLGDDSEEVPSPTFALVQTYDAGRLPIAHIDCYRMEEPAELREIGLGEALAGGAALIEWPERVESALPVDRLEIAFADAAREDQRALTLTAYGSWEPRLERLRQMMQFCEESGWKDARPVFLQGDASTRAYARLERDGGGAVLMDSPPQPDGPPIRNGKPYSALAHLAEDVRPFVAVADGLRAAGLSAPEILAHDLENGFLILEDLGDRVFTTEALKSRRAMETLYRAGVDALLALRQHPPPDALSLPDGNTHTLPRYDAAALEIEAELLLDWFYPAVADGEAPEEAREEYLLAWRAHFRSLEGRDEGWVLRDFHSPNLIWLDERSGVARVGILDFQDALRGHAAYDLVSLLQDARLEVPLPLEGELFGHYCAVREADDSSFDRSAFSAAYAALGAQRNSKILGIFARLAKRDGKHGYLAHIPRVSACLERNLRHEALEGLRAWYDRYLPPEMRMQTPRI